jgi:NDP-sugar pyrophosphorylase family protein
LHHREDPTRSGIVGLDENDRVTRFLEKPRPDQIFSHWVNAGILVLQREVLDAIPAGVVVDLGRDILPALLERDSAIFGYRMAQDESLWWIDTAQDLARVEQSLVCKSGQVRNE